MNRAAFEPDPASHRNRDVIYAGNTEVAYAGYNGTNTGEQKAATVGGILRGGEGFFVMTVAHIFPGYEGGLFPSTAAPLDFEYEIDAWSDDDMDMDDTELEQMSEASMSPPSSDSDDAKFWDKSQSPAKLERLQERRNSRFPHSRDVGGNRNEESSSNSTTSSEHRKAQAEDGNIEKIMQQPILSLDSENQYLDYALLPISASQLRTFVGGFTEEHQNLGKGAATSSHTIEIKPRTSVDVVVITASGGNISGQLLATPTFLKRAHAENHQELWSLNLQGSLAKGDSGSWVQDAKTGEVYGHLIAGGPGTGFGYVVPMLDVLADLKQRFSGTRQIFKPNDGPLCTSEGARVHGKGLDSKFILESELKKYFGKAQAVEKLLKAVNAPIDYQFDTIENQLTWFKLGLSDEATERVRIELPQRYERLQKLLKKHGKTPIDVVAGCLRCLWAHAAEIMKAKIGEILWTNLRLKIVLTVPAIWDHKAQELTKRAAEMAGMLERDDTTLELVAEPEAAALSVFNEMNPQGVSDFQVGESFVICDAGGGTVVIPLSLATVCEATGGLCGSNFLDSVFEKHIRAMISVDEFEKLGSRAKRQFMEE
ncbi:hypothetical protein G7Y89_g14392 [Cudoniella acicularis]|uniref:Uncharacterized protein n=1 Tax=Cudoniella acicularis TaxID=354080 RepID=A0A8H4R578_9HELO|nr:hypothetical protein G7Y89_g14392 [Cudoniella acicularis]